MRCAALAPDSIGVATPGLGRARSSSRGRLIRWPGFSDDGDVNTTDRGGPRVDVGVDPAQHPSPSRRGMGSVQNMVLSMVVVLGFVLVLLVLVPRPKGIDQPPVNVHAAGQQVVRETGWPILEPRGLGSGWKATSVRFSRSTDGLRTWHAGYLTPGGKAYAGLEQTSGATAAWIAAETAGGSADGTMTIAGRDWEKLAAAGQNRRALMHRGGASGVLTTVVTGTAPYDQLAELVNRLEPITEDADGHERR